ncbi:MAG: hypothetical protein KIS66_01015 [Fimbriimonadaceae bacterium]|nr:hypothetical protein [Fimbriimonadaceae bacterium]
MRRFLALAVLLCALVGCGGTPTGGAPPPTDVRLVARLEPGFRKVADSSDDGQVLVGTASGDGPNLGVATVRGAQRAFPLAIPGSRSNQLDEVTPDGRVAAGIYDIEDSTFRLHSEAFMVALSHGDEASAHPAEINGRKRLSRLVADGTLLLTWDAAPMGFDRKYSWRDPGPVQPGWPAPLEPYAQEPKLLFGQTGAAIGVGQSDNGRWAVGYAWKTSREADGEPFLYGPDGTPERLPEIGNYGNTALVAGDGNTVAWNQGPDDQATRLWIRGRGVVLLEEALREGGMTGFELPRPSRFSDNGRFLVGTVNGAERSRFGFVLEIIRP